MYRLPIGRIIKLNYSRYIKDMLEHELARKIFFILKLRYLSENFLSHPRVRKMGERSISESMYHSVLKWFGHGKRMEEDSPKEYTLPRWVGSKNSLEGR